MEINNTPAAFKRTRSCTEELGSFKIIHTDTTANGKSLNGTRKTVSEYKIVYNETRQTNRHKNPSGVWKHFALATKDLSANPNDSPDDRLLCMLCYAKGRVHVYKIKTSSSNLWKHLNRKHDIEIPTEKMFANSMVNFDGFDFNPEPEEHSYGGEHTNDEHLAGLDIDENGEIVIKTDNFDEMEGFQEEQIIATSIEDRRPPADVFIKYEEPSSEAVFRDIGLAIIEEVAKRPLLYEMQPDKSPSTSAAMDSMWMEVYDSLGAIIDVDRIQNIWKNIRDRYKRIRASEKEGFMESSQKYKYYNQLRFLDDVLAVDHMYDSCLNEEEPPEKKSRTDDYSFLIEQTDDTDRSEQNYIAEEIIPDGESNDQVDPITATIHPSDIIQNHCSDDELTKHSSPATASTSSTSAQSDEFDLFGKFIAEKLRSAPKERVDLIEIKILQVILENS